MSVANFELNKAAHLSRPEQLERAFGAMNFAGCAIGLYGLLQYDGMDPLPWPRRARVEVRSTLGNEIFLAAYLVGTLTVTAYRRTRGAENVLPASDARAVLLRILILAGVVLLTLAWWRSTPIRTAALLAPLSVFAVVSGRLRRSRRAGVAVGTHVAVLSVQLACFLMMLYLDAGECGRARGSAAIHPRASADRSARDRLAPCLRYVRHRALTWVGSRSGARFGPRLRAWRCAQNGRASRFDFYNARRRHSVLDRRTPDEVYFDQVTPVQAA